MSHKLPRNILENFVTLVETSLHKEWCLRKENVQDIVLLEIRENNKMKYLF